MTSVAPSTSTLPSALICPINCAPFVDPVIAEDGNTYERSAIEQWFSTGQRTSPLTRQRISTTLIPNRAVREEVERLTATASTAAAAAVDTSATTGTGAETVVLDGPLSTAAFYDDARHLLHV